jgi:hypothetical protein
MKTAILIFEPVKGAPFAELLDSVDEAAVAAKAARGAGTRNKTAIRSVVLIRVNGPQANIVKTFRCETAEQKKAAAEKPVEKPSK